MPVDYQLAKIYKIEALNPEHESDVYIGSTCKPTLSKRMSKHKCDYNRWKDGKHGNMSSFKLFEKYSVQIFISSNSLASIIFLHTLDLPDEIPPATPIKNGSFFLANILI